jgi:hypothetical protein
VNFSSSRFGKSPGTFSRFTSFHVFTVLSPVKAGSPIPIIVARAVEA